jgi:hypothetical protein
MRYLVTLAALLVVVAAVADDGELFNKNVSKTPDLETEHATVKMLKLYVPAQSSDGTLLTDGIDYIDAEGAIADNRAYAKPIVAFYHDGHVVSVPDVGFPGHGEKDVFGAVSLDDGATYKRTNLSNTGDLSSFTLSDGTAYPGDTFRLFAASAGNKVMVAWASRYCRDGGANYTMTDDEREAMATYLGLDVNACTDVDSDGDAIADTPCFYLEDYWGIAGSQGSSDFADEGYPTVGEVPYACLWVARGTLELTDADGNYDEAGDHYNIIWRKAERLTSGRRDVHRIETKAVSGAGFVITWQEDPDGLRPGKGEGPGEGWSGAIAHHETDIWYTYIDWDHFDLVDGETIEGYGDPITLAEATTAGLEGVPKVGVPFAMPVRLTDNAKCAGPAVDGTDDAYCYADFDGSGTADFCASSVIVTIETPEGPVQDTDLCVAEDGRVMRGNIAATRARTHLQGYDSDGDGIEDSAWVSLAYEESKGLGEEEDLDPNDLIEKVDMGKNIWYHTFNMFEPELVSQGLQLNQPAVYPDDWSIVGDRLVEDTSSGYRFMDIDPDPIYEDQAGLTSTLYQNEIARRFSMITQPAHLAGPSGTVAFAMFKQGIVRQGGPANVMARRFVLPDTFDPAVDNPFDYANMVCDGWQFEDGSNPRYVKGLCVTPPINMSGTSIVSCDNGSTGEDCALQFPWNEYFDDIDMSASEDGLAKLTEWTQVDPDTDTEGNGNFDDPTWENPYEVAKGHRGFMFGDFIMMMYAWSPNWMANAVGHDNYNLYVRRSFDGGVTWTTLPVDFAQTLPEGVEITADGTETCEIYRSAVQGEDDPVVCTTYGAGEFEPARNVSQLIGTKLTVLDPRFTGTKATPSVTSILTDGVLLYPDDEHDPSKFFVTFEVGDNTTVEFGEATPLDMYYSRAFNYGDDFELVETDDPVTGELTYYFDWLENKKPYHAAEAAVMANPGGTFFYAIWNQWQEDAHENVFDSDARLRRIMFLDDELITPPSGGGGGGGGGKPGTREFGPSRTE